MESHWFVHKIRPTKGTIVKKRRRSELAWPRAGFEVVLLCKTGRTANCTINLLNRLVTVQSFGPNLAV